MLGGQCQADGSQGSSWEVLGACGPDILVRILCCWSVAGAWSSRGRGKEECGGNIWQDIRVTLRTSLQTEYSEEAAFQALGRGAGALMP